MLCDHEWKLKYTPDDGDLVTLFYVPALEAAERYDRLTGYFNAGALALAARGIEGLVRNGGHMRLIVGCTLAPPEIEAIEKGEQLRDLVERHLTNLPLAPPDPASSDALELLAWMVARGHLDVKVASPATPMASRSRRMASFTRRPASSRTAAVTRSPGTAASMRRRPAGGTTGRASTSTRAGGWNPSGSLMRRPTSHGSGPTRRTA